MKYLAERCPRDTIELITAEAVHNNPPNCWKGIPIHYTFGVRCWPFYPTLTFPVDWTGRAIRRIWQLRPGIIHVATPGWFVLSAWAASRWFQIPLVVSYHSHLPHYLRAYLPSWIYDTLLGGDWFSWRIIKWMHSLSDLTLVTSPQIQQEFRDHGVLAKDDNGNPNPKCVLWPKGVNTAQFHPKHYNATMRHRMSNGHVDDLLILCLGRLAKEKRYTDVFEILDRLPDNCRLCFVGSGPMEEKLKRLSQVKHASRVVFMCQLTGTALQQAYASADIFCMPSDSETLGFVVMESMASKVPVVAARAGGIPDMIEDGVTGFLVPTGDIGAFADRILQWLHDPELRHRMARVARQRSEQWSWEASMSKVRQEYYPMAVINERRRRKRRWWSF